MTPESGQALGLILGDVERERGGAIVSVTTHPARLILPEWTKLVRLTKMPNSTLAEDLNDLFDFPPDYQLTRSDREKTGGRIVYPDPELTICATTTTELFRQEVDRRLLQSGFVNRYLILPGGTDKWRFHNRASSKMDFERLSLVRDQLEQAPAWEKRETVWDHYDKDAEHRLKEWAEIFFETELMNGPATGPAADAYRRLHVYAHKVAMIYAAQYHRQDMTIEDVECAITVVETSKKFLDYLLDDAELSAPAIVQYDLDLLQKIREKIRKNSGQYTRREIRQRVRAKSNKIEESINELIRNGDVSEKSKCLMSFLAQPWSTRRP
jgi:hypothetical protein